MVHAHICSGFRANLPTAQCCGLTRLAGGNLQPKHRRRTKESKSTRGTSMTKFITLLIGISLAFAAVAQAKPAPQENPKNKKSKPVQQQQVAPKQRVAPKQQQTISKQQRPVPTERGPKGAGPMKEPMETMKKPWKDASTTPEVRPNRHVVQPNTLPAVQSNKLNKTVKNFQPRHRNFHAKVNPSIATARFNQNFRIRNAQNWKGHHYNAFRTYRPQWHDQNWWRSNHSHIVLIGGGWYYWNSGYWYPAWGYDDSAAYYPYRRAHLCRQQPTTVRSGGGRRAGQLAGAGLLSWRSGRPGRSTYPGSAGRLSERPRS